MIEQEKIRQLLLREFAGRQARNSRYSMQAFARSLAIGTPALSEILRGKRKISQTMAVRLVDKLAVDPVERSKTLAYFGEARAGASKKPRTKPIERLESDQYQVISDWYHFAILSLAETKDFVPEAAHVAARLGLPITVAEGALERLERLGFLKRVGKRLIPKDAQFSTSDELQSYTLQKSHRNNLALAEQSLDKDPVESRDFSAITMAIDPKKLPIAKRMIREFTDNLCGFLESEEKEEVYKVCVQLFPLSRS